MLPEVKWTKEKFFRTYAERSGLTVEELKKLGGVAEKCDCGIEGCHGWQMITEHGHRRLVMSEEKAEVAETEEEEMKVKSVNETTLTKEEEEAEEKNFKYGLTEDSNNEINRRFTYHAPNEDQLPRYTMLRDEARNLALLIQQNTPPSREQSLALTKLEESVMWANASIARRE